MEKIDYSVSSLDHKNYMILLFIFFTEIHLHNLSVFLCNQFSRTHEKDRLNFKMQNLICMDNFVKGQMFMSKLVKHGHEHLAFNKVIHTLQTLTGKLQGRISTQGDPCSHYR